MQPFEANCSLLQRPIFLVGYMGAGKSTLGRKLARLLETDFIDTDIYIENRFRKKIAAIFQEEGEEVFRRREKMVLDELTGYAGAVISTGGGLPCYHGNMETMLSCGTTIYLRYTAEELARRLLAAPRNRPLLRGLEGDALLKYISDTLASREAFYLQAHLVVSCMQVCCQEDENELAHYILTLLQDPLFLSQCAQRNESAPGEELLEEGFWPK